MFKRTLTVTMLLALATGCGFHLRGTFSIPKPLQILRILPNQPYDTFQQALRQTLKMNGVEIVDQNLAKIKDAATLTLLDQAFTERTVAYGSDGQPNRAILQFKMHYRVTDAKGTMLTEAVAQIERELTLNPNAVLGTDNERARLKSDMMLENACQIVRQLSVITL